MVKTPKNTSSYLRWYVPQADQAIKSFLDEKAKEAKKISPITDEVIKVFRNLLKGGKKLRGAQVVLGYQSQGGTDIPAIINASIAFEIIHAGLLIHDDIMDQDDLRRGAPTIHRQFENYHLKNYPHKRGHNHYGTSMAICLGDFALIAPQLILAQAKFPAERITKAIEILNQGIIETAYGQALDVTYESQSNLTVADVLRVHQHKTSHYTVSDPLAIGAALAGAKEKVFSAINNYGTPVGTAFQIKDDILGMFSTEKILGKPVDSDLKERKNTLLIIKALELGNDKQQEFVNYAWGNKTLSQTDIEWARKIIRETRSLEFSEKLARKLVEQGKKFIYQIAPDQTYQKLLGSLADFMITRQS